MIKWRAVSEITEIAKKRCKPATSKCGYVSKVADIAEKRYKSQRSEAVIVSKIAQNA
ncbi:MAG: hypothetical protein IKV96_02805 [Firmicutes bacterium]|nr:hypothetical protein [Bacillota bacterium]